MQVTNAADHMVELRALECAANSLNGWDLRCVVRERLIAFIQETIPEGPLKVRAGFSELKTK
jgi:hypothetical protein